jgi:hypothetical protein
MIRFALALLLLSVPALHAQTSANFRVEEHVLNGGGHPSNGTVLTSTSFNVSLDAIGDPIAATALTSSSFALDSGFVSAYPPSLEVNNLRFSSATNLTWNPEKSVGAYNIYRGSISDLPGGFGACLTANLSTETASDSDTPPPGQAFFYIITAENRLGQEGSKGFTSSGSERSNASPCTP